VEFASPKQEEESLGREEHMMTLPVPSSQDADSQLSSDMDKSDGTNYFFTRGLYGNLSPNKRRGVSGIHPNIPFSSTQNKGRNRWKVGRKAR
jgi:hypothetical protein